MTDLLIAVEIAELKVLLKIIKQTILFKIYFQTVDENKKYTKEGVSRWSRCKRGH